MITRLARRLLVLGVAACCAGGLCGGCSRGHAVPEGVAYASYRPSGSGGDSALLEGVLEVVSGCLVVATPQSERFLPIWPGRRIPAQVGEQVHLGGGYHPAGEEMSFASIPQECAQLQLVRFMVY